jgi:hypothetical protein
MQDPLSFPVKTTIRFNERQAHLGSPKIFSGKEGVLIGQKKIPRGQAGNCYKIF